MPCGSEETRDCDLRDRNPTTKNCERETMLNAFSTIGMNVTGTLSKVAKLARRQTIVAAAVAATGLIAASQANAANTGSDVTAITTNLTSGFVQQQSMTGYGTAASGFTSDKTYNLTYLGEDEAVTSVTTSTGTYIPAGLASTTVRRFSGPNTDIIWYEETPQGNANTPNLTLYGTPSTSFAQAFAANNLLLGTDNLFTNTGNRAGNDTNVERLDTIYNVGFKASSSTAFTIFDRGVNSQHDGFGIAAITGLDANGVPDAYGPLVEYSFGSWGKTSLNGTNNFIVTRQNDDAPDGYHPSDEDVQQTLGGTLLTTNDLVPTGTTIYGYSLFAADTTDPTGSSDLVNWTNPTYFPTDTDGGGTTAATDAGGLDAIGTTAVLYTAVPEPTTASIFLIAAGGLLARRNRKA